jgi:hypothetical protein
MPVKRWADKKLPFVIYPTTRFKGEEPHEDVPGFPIGIAHGSGRIGAGIRKWRKGTESKLTEPKQRQSAGK